MESWDNIPDELRDFNSGLPSASGPNPYSVPEGYFEGLAGSVMAKIKAQTALSAAEEIASLSPFLAGISRSMPYAVPDHYFQTTIEELPFLTGEDPQSAILSLVERVTPYQVPLGYFANLPEQILEKVARQKAKVVPITRRKWMRMAAAAMVGGIIAVSGFFYLNQKTNRFDAGKPIAQQLKNVSTKELDDFIKTADITPASTETATVAASKASDVRRMLKDVSDKELDAFINQVPTDDEDLLVIN